MIYLFIGAMKCLYDKELLTDVQEISASSCGSLIGYFYILFNGDMNKVTQVAVETSLKSAAKPDLKTFINKFGFIDASKIEKIIIKTAGCDPTFKELYEMNPIKLHIPTFDLMSNRTIYMSVDTTPDMKVSRAIRKSISVPVVFTPCREDGHLYLDGSTIEANPFAPFLGKTDVFELRWKRKLYEKQIPKSVFEYVKMLIFSFFDSSNRMSEYMQFDKIELYSDHDDQSYNFASITDDMKMKIFHEGYSQMLSRLKYI